MTKDPLTEPKIISISVLLSKEIPTPWHHIGLQALAEDYKKKRIFASITGNFLLHENIWQ